MSYSETPEESAAIVNMNLILMGSAGLESEEGRTPRHPAASDVVPEIYGHSNSSIARGGAS